MKRIIILMSLLLNILFINSLKAQQVIVTDDSTYTTPANGAVLDVKSTTKGFMPPRVALNSLTDTTTIPSRTNGLLIYNTGVGSLTDKGVYYWCDSIWVKPLSGGIGGTNFMSIASDGTVLLHGSATTWNDLVVNPAMAQNKTPTAPAWSVFVPNIFTWAFEDSKTDEVYFYVQLPHNYKEGSDIYPHVHWSGTTAPGLQRVKWGLDYQWVNLNDNFSSSAITTISGSGVETGDATTNLNAYEHTITPILGSGVNGGIVGTEKKISSMILCHFYRLGSDAEDTYTGSAYLLSFDFHYEIDSFGSSQQYTK